jgi:TonB family protein
VPSLPAVLCAAVIAVSAQAPRIELARLHPDFSGSWTLARTDVVPAAGAGSVPAEFAFGPTLTILQASSTIQIGSWQVRLDGSATDVGSGVSISTAWEGDDLVITSRATRSSHRCVLRLLADGALAVEVATQSPENTLIARNAYTRATGPGTVGPGGVYTPGRGVTAPVLTHDERPTYAQPALVAGIEGRVELDVTVLADGSVDPTTVTVTQSLDKKYGLDDRAIAAAKLWRFRPAVQQATGTAVPCRVSIVITFKIGG